MALDREKIAHIKNSVNIVDVIRDVTPLTKTGRHYLGLCPFHKEKTPSFNVLEDKQFYHCFGCGQSGDVFKFLEETRQIPFLEAVGLVAERAGIDWQGPSGSSVQPRQQDPHHQLYAINQDAAKFYQAVLMTTTAGQPAQAYLAQRGLDEQVLTYFQIGLAPAEPDFLYRSVKDKYDEATLANSGLFQLTEDGRFLDAFRDRIIFPLLDDQGRTIGFSGRIWQDKDQGQAKYKNTRSTPIFNKSAAFYHLDKAKPIIKKAQEVYLMEGFMDVIAAHRAGIDNAVATMGTALTQDHVAGLKPLAKKVILSYDGDGAGQAAIDKALQLLQGFEVAIVSLPDNLDPDDYLQQHSPEALGRLLTQSRISQVEFYSRYYLPDNLDNLQAQIAYVERLAPLIAREPSLTAQHTYFHLLADLLPDYDYVMVEQAVSSFQGSPGPGDLGPSQKSPAQPVSWQWALPQQQTSGGLTRLEEQLLYRLLTEPSLSGPGSLPEGFSFSQSHLQELYQLWQQEGNLDSYSLSQASDQVQQAYYRLLSGQFTDQMEDGEWADLLVRRDYYLERQALAQQEKAIRDYSKRGEVDQATAALAALIAQKRHLE